MEELGPGIEGPPERRERVGSYARTDDDHRAAVRISSSGAMRVLAASIGGLVGLALLGGLYEFAAGKPADATVAGLVLQLIDLDSETSVATWFSIIVLAAAAVGAVIAGGSEARPSDRRRWWALAVVFAYLSIDESSQIHESVTPLVRSALDLDPEGVLRFAWVLPFAAATLVFIVLFGRFLWSLPDGTRKRVIGGLSLYVLGALGVEAMHSWALTVTDPGVLTGMLVVVEETLEMVGASLVLLGVFWHLESLRGGVIWERSDDAIRADRKQSWRQLRRWVDRGSRSRPRAPQRR